MRTIAAFLDHGLHLAVHQEVEQEEDHEPFLEYWGYTIYRTYYGHGSDEQ